MQVFHSKGADFAYTEMGAGDAAPVVVWAHGWGQSHAAFLPLADSLAGRARHILFDFPGFGEAPPPPEGWGTEDYADAVAAWLEEKNFPPVIWTGHSFGCRVGLQLAARHPARVAALCLVAGAGLKRKRPLHKALYFYVRIRLFKLLRRFVPSGAFKDKLMACFGSADYKTAGPMRRIFVRVVNEDLSDVAKTVSCPVKLVYGAQDTETPPEFGKRFSQLIPGSELFLLDGLDHYSILSTGRHQVVKIINDLLKETINKK
ncbi:MAG: alpha/beta hydrolase [Alphaproteobacteria bacterium]|nr:alpha/beta hydrolase [Alphaproteobacteria bacterium]